MSIKINLLAITVHLCAALLKPVLFPKAFSQRSIIYPSSQKGSCSNVPFTFFFSPSLSSYTRPSCLENSIDTKIFLTGWFAPFSGLGIAVWLCVCLFQISSDMLWGVGGCGIQIIHLFGRKSHQIILILLLLLLLFLQVSHFTEK